MAFSGHTGVAASRGLLSALAVTIAVSGCASASPDTELVAEASPQATVLITEPEDGAELPSGDVRVVLGAENITIVSAGDTSPNSGHHHLLLDVAIPAEGEAIPAGEPGFVHLGQAQTEYTFEGLAPGDYTLIAVIGDFAHRVFPQATDTVRFTVLAPQ